jgi:hypothetical protein
MREEERFRVARRANGLTVSAVKKELFPLYVLLAASQVHAAEPAPAVAAPAAYVEEAPLPAGWPKPGPYDKVTEKIYPTYRAAFTNGKGETGAFWTLFLHIKRHGIPMTAPVEMAMADADGKLQQDGMAFLYQNGKIGQSGPDGSKVEVRDVPASTVLSYTWKGDDSQSNIAKARTELETALAAQKKQSKTFRLLGYNGPGTPRLERTWELQAVLK